MEAAAPASVVVDVPATVGDAPAPGVGASEPPSDGDAPSSSSSSAPELPAWALAVAGDDDSDEDEEDCHICRLTAEEMGEPLIRPCACASMPVHASCRELLHDVASWSTFAQLLTNGMSAVETWRTQCANPASARRCPTCRERYRLPDSPRVADDGDDDDDDDQAPPDWGRVATTRRRFVHQNGGGTWLPPADFGAPACRTAAFCSWSSLAWLTSAILFWALGLTSLADDQTTASAFELLRQNSLFSLWCDVLGFIAARFRNWFTLKIFVYFLGIQLMIQVVMLMLEVLFGIINAERAASEWHVYQTFVYVAQLATVAHAGVAIWLVSPFYDELDPNRRRRAASQRRRRERQRRRRAERARQQQETADQDGGDVVAVTMPAGAVAGATVQIGTAETGLFEYAVPDGVAEGEVFHVRCPEARDGSSGAPQEAVVIVDVVGNPLAQRAEPVQTAAPVDDGLEAALLS